MRPKRASGQGWQNRLLQHSPFDASNLGEDEAELSARVAELEDPATGGPADLESCDPPAEQR